MDLKEIRKRLRPPGPALDVHVHPLRGFGPHKVETVEEDAGWLIAGAARAGVEKICLFSVHPTCPPEPTMVQCREANDYVLRMREVAPELFLPFCYASPAFPDESVAEIERCVEGERMVGIKLWIARRASDPGLDPILEKAVELGVPVLDPTIPSWREELDRARGQARLVKLVPAYSQYELTEAEELLEALEEGGLGVIVQTRIEDPRRQHPLAQVPDLAATAVAKMAEKHPALVVILGGPTWRTILDLRDVLLNLPNFYAEVSQADGMDSLKLFVEAGLTDRLLFGTHAPLFVPMAGLARVVTDLEDEPATAILGGNAQRILGSSA